LSSLRRITSSRANGARSLGPKTPAGKLQSSANAIKHGLLAKCVVLETESEECFQDLLTSFLNRFQPGDDVELGIVEELLAASWRQRRAWAMETKLLDTSIAARPAAPDGDERVRLTSGFEAASNQPSLELVHRYETRLNRIYKRALNNLVVLRMLSSVQDPEDDPAPDPTIVEISTLPNEPNPINEHPEPSVDDKI